MDLIQEAIEYLESHEAGDKFSYREVAKMFKVDQTTLSRRYKGAQRAQSEEAPSFSQIVVAGAVTTLCSWRPRNLSALLVALTP